MARFKEIKYDAKAQTVTVGSGNTWDDVYTALAPFNVGVVGGRIRGIGVMGFLLGGGMLVASLMYLVPEVILCSGFSWLTGQHGLGLDNVLSFELVLPTGKIVNVTETSQPDLFFGLRVGRYRFV